MVHRATAEIKEKGFIGLEAFSDDLVSGEIGFIARGVYCER